MTKVLMISTDRKLFEENSDVRQRIIGYGKAVEELHVIVFTKNGFKNQNFGNVYLYPTNSINRWFYVCDAIKIGRSVLKEERSGGEMSGLGSQWLATSQDPFETGFVGHWMATKFNIQLQLQIHTDFLSPYFNGHSVFNKIRVRIAKYLIPKASSIRVVSNRIKDSLVASGYLLDPSKIVVQPISVDLEKIKNSPINIDLHKKYPQFDFIILMASRFEKEKNIKMAIDAMKDVVKEYPKTGLIIVGAGSEILNLKSQIAKLKLQNNIIIEDWQNDLNSYYKTANLFLLTSNYEGYGITLVSANTCGCKIISTDVGVANEILSKENIIKVGDTVALKEKIIETIKKSISY